MAKKSSSKNSGHGCLWWIFIGWWWCFIKYLAKAFVWLTKWALKDDGQLSEPGAKPINIEKVDSDKDARR